jgi:hypothetical protein
MQNIINVGMIVIGLFAIVNRKNIYSYYGKINLHNKDNVSKAREYFATNPNFREFIIKYKYWIPVALGLILILRGIIGFYTSSLW